MRSLQFTIYNTKKSNLKIPFSFSLLCDLRAFFADSVVKKRIETLKIEYKTIFFVTQNHPNLPAAGGFTISLAPPPSKNLQFTMRSLQPARLRRVYNTKRSPSKIPSSFSLLCALLAFFAVFVVKKRIETLKIEYKTIFFVTQNHPNLPAAGGFTISLAPPPGKIYNLQCVAYNLQFTIQKRAT